MSGQIFYSLKQARPALQCPQWTLIKPAKGVKPSGISCSKFYTYVQKPFSLKGTFF